VAAFTYPRLALVTISAVVAGNGERAAFGRVEHPVESALFPSRLPGVRVAHERRFGRGGAQPSVRSVQVHLGDTPHCLTKEDFQDLARRTEGFSGSDVGVMVKDVLFEPVCILPCSLPYLRLVLHGFAA
jgi:hypothetical protein